MGEPKSLQRVEVKRDQAEQNQISNLIQRISPMIFNALTHWPLLQVTSSEGIETKQLEDGFNQEGGTIMIF